MILCALCGLIFLTITKFSRRVEGCVQREVPESRTYEAKQWCNMTGKILLIMIVLVGLVLSGCIENGVQVADNNTTDASANVSDNVTANASEHVERRSVSIPLEKPPFIEDQ